jgi:hypothetical protein
MTYSVVNLNEGVVDGDNLDRAIVDAVERVRIKFCTTRGSQSSLTHCGRRCGQYDRNR